MKTFTVILISLLLVSCKPDEQPENIVKTSNNIYRVEKLFTVDGVTVYRFNDAGNYVYFTNRTGIAEYDYQRRTGKTVTTERIQTICDYDSARHNTDY